MGQRREKDAVKVERRKRIILFRDGCFIVLLYNYWVKKLQSTREEMKMIHNSKDQLTIADI